MPASASARSNTCPAGPTNGRPCRSSWSPGCSPTKAIAAPTGPSPSTARVPPSTIGGAAAIMRLSSSSEAGACSAMAATAFSGLRCAGMLASFEIIASTRDEAERTIAGIAAVSGRLRQYFFGISARVCTRFSRAGLKVLS